jgi:hypothetical protein
MQSLLQKLLFGNAGGGGGGNPALNLSFVDGGTFDPRITFSRTSNATLTDSNGRVSYAPHNLLANSEDVEASAWAKFSGFSVAPNTTVAPDGTTTADTITFTSSSSNTRITLPSVTAGATYVFSIWAQSLTGVNTLSIDIGDGTGVVLTVPATFTRISVPIVAGSAGAFMDIVGGGAATMVWWGAQLNIANAPVNLLTWSEDFSNAAWAKTALNTTGTPAWVNVAVAPDGTTTAEKLIPDSTTAYHFFRQTFSNGSSAAAFQIYAKAAELRFLRILIAGTGWNAYCAFDVLNGIAGSVTGNSATGLSASITSVGNGWYLCAIGATGINAANGVEISSNASLLPNDSTVTGNGTSGFFIWGAQLNTGSTALPYVATTSSIYLPPTYNSTTPKNLLGFTQEFDNAAWTKTATTITVNAAVAPDGYTTADKLVETATNTQHFINSTGNSVPANTPGTASFYAKAAERSTVVTTASGSSLFLASFDLLNGVVSSVTGGTATISFVGNGWYRCTFTCTTTAFANQAYIHLNSYGSYAGDGTSGIFIWGAQLSNSASVDPYVYNPQAAPTSTAYYGPRIDYDPVTLASRGLLIEEQRTNLLTYSEDFSNAAWTKQQSTISANSAVAPDGVTTADKVIPNSGFEGYVFRGTTIVSGAAAFSIYVKAAEWNFVYVAFGASFSPTNGTYIRLSDGAVTSGSGFTAQSVGNGWYRISGSSTYSTAADNSVYVIPTNSGVAPRTTGDGTSGIYLWGAQMEAGAFATSYVPTVASQVTRNGDVASMLGDNFLRWYNATQGVFLVSADSFASSSLLVRQSVVANDGTSSNLIRTYTYDGKWGGSVSAGGVAQADLLTATVPVPNVSVKFALAYQANNFAGCINGGTVLTDTSGVVPTVTKLDLGQYPTAGNPLNGRIQQVTYYPSRLTNAALQQITT